ncbi:alpha-glucosidase [Algoriphagus ratkowskyi]|uniref:Alpha-glucosidase n=1 Tax=Algoriphagus ratkowskyi TaxID=57028 RepID=A0A2W7RE12_9BACT|nr:glycoside hydrolase family 31 protein [Algoriphagus ratkowskyi]PZX52439.1 alpha-glucosidase [Algoriphagus ratkowskyi]TXD76212.1 glycoside hydrolase family 31 protein [Algoriphagus ratkowskyi]
MINTNQVPSQNQSSSRYIPIGKIGKWTKTSNGFLAESEVAQVKISVFREGTLRIQASQNSTFDPNPYSVIAEAAPVEFSLEEREDYLILKTSLIHLQFELLNGICTFFDASGTLLNKDDSLGISWIGTEVTCYKELQVDEKFIGLGEKTGDLNRRGRAYTNWNTDYFGYGINDDPLYASIPFYIGLIDQKAYGIYLDNTHKSVFNFGASNNRFAYFNAEDGDMDYYFIHQPSVAEIISSYTELTGKMKMPPKWALGYQQCRYSYYPDTEVLTLASTFRDKDMPADVIYLDIHHMEEYKVFSFDGEKFTDPKGLILKLKEKGFRVVVILDPGIKTQVGYAPFEEGTAQGLFVQYPDGKAYEGQVWPGWCTFPDFTNPKTRAWWMEKMAFYTEAGVDGFWTDMNEPASWGQFTPNLIEFDYDGNTASHRKARNIYGMQMAKSTQEGSEANLPNRRPFVLTRAGFAGVQRFAAIWTGDNVSTEEHMLAGVRLVNSLGLSGLSFSGYDVGGFAGESTKSLFARWMSIATFSPLFRSHSMINSNDAEPWAFGEEVEEISRTYMKLRYKLMPTIYSKFRQSSQTGLPVAASLAIAYSDDPLVFLPSYQNQYLFCDSFLIAPVESYKEIMKVYLPKGDWYYFFTDQPSKGGQVIYQDCPLNNLPVFIKAGSILAMQNSVAHTAAKNDGVLRIHLYAGAEGSEYVHYEDDGVSYDFETGAYLERIFTYSPENQKLSISEATGSFPSQFDVIRIYLHGFTSDKIMMGKKTLSVNKKSFAFLDKLSEFDPLPDLGFPHLSIPNLQFVDISILSTKMEITGLV